MDNFVSVRVFLGFQIGESVEVVGRLCGAPKLYAVGPGRIELYICSI